MPSALSGPSAISVQSCVATSPPSYPSYRHCPHHTSGRRHTTCCRQAGDYTIAIIAGGFDGFAPETSPVRPGSAGGTGGEGRGSYTLTVRHAQFAEGSLGQAGSRAGCLANGQARNYTLQTSGSSDGNLYAALDSGNVSRLRVRCDGCDWVEAAHPIRAISASPCSMRNATNWTVQVAARAGGSTPTWGVPLPPPSARALPAARAPRAATCLACHPHLARCGPNCDGAGAAGRRGHGGPRGARAHRICGLGDAAERHHRSRAGERTGGGAGGRGVGARGWG